MTVRIVFRKVEKQFCHAHSHPAIATSPIKGHIGCMIKKTVLTLNLIQIKHHFLGSAVDVFFISRHMIGFGLHDGNHIHIINPKASLPRVSFLMPFTFFIVCLLRKNPLRIGIR